MISKIHEFQNAAKPLMDYLSENYNPHTRVILDSTEAEILSGLMCFNRYPHEVEECQLDAEIKERVINNLNKRLDKIFFNIDVFVHEIFGCKQKNEDEKEQEKFFNRIKDDFRQRIFNYVLYKSFKNADYNIKLKEKEGINHVLNAALNDTNPFGL